MWQLLNGVPSVYPHGMVEMSYGVDFSALFCSSCLPEDAISRP